MVRILTRLAAAFFLVAASAHADQPSRLDDIVKRGALRVGMTGDYLPFTYPDKATSKFRGFDVDMADDALGRRAPPMGLQRSWKAIEATGEAGAGTSIDIAGQQA